METKEDPKTLDDRAITFVRMLPGVLVTVALVRIPSQYKTYAEKLSLWLVIVWSAFTIAAIIRTGKARYFRTHLICAVGLALLALVYEWVT